MIIRQSDLKDVEEEENRDHGSVYISIPDSKQSLKKRNHPAI